MDFVMIVDKAFALLFPRSGMWLLNLVSDRLTQIPQHQLLRLPWELVSRVPLP